MVHTNFSLASSVLLNTRYSQTQGGQTCSNGCGHKTRIFIKSAVGQKNFKLGETIIWVPSIVQKVFITPCGC